MKTPRSYLVAAFAVSILAAPGHAENKPPAAPAPAQAPASQGAKEDTLSPETKALAKRELAPAVVSERVRKTLRQEMKHHGGDWKGLSAAVVLLSYPEVDQYAQHLAIEPRIAKDPGHVAGLGEAFFQLQEELRAHANELREAAAAKDPKGVALGLGRVAETCTTCHAIYRKP